MEFEETYFTESRYGKQPEAIIQRNYRILLQQYENLLGQEGEILVHNILDFGCGTGIGTAVLRRYFGCRVIGIDISRFAIEKAKEKNRGDEVDFLQCDLTKPGGSDGLREKVGLVDMVFSRDTLEHIDRNLHETTLANLANVLRDKGFILVQTPNRWHPFSRLIDQTHVGLRSPWDWGKLFRERFADVNVRVGQYVPVLWRMASFGYREFPLPIIGFHVYVSGRQRVRGD